MFKVSDLKTISKYCSYNTLIARSCIHATGIMEWYKTCNMYLFAISNEIIISVVWWSSEEDVRSSHNFSFLYWLSFGS